MHPLFERASGLTETVIAAAIEVHRDKGLGLIESIYEWCLLKELELRGLEYVSQKSVVIEYKGFTREEPLRFDVLVEGCVLVEAKAVEKVLPIPQVATLELYEAAERSCRTTDQLPRDESHQWHPPADFIWCEQMSDLIQQQRT